MEASSQSCGQRRVVLERRKQRCFKILIENRLMLKRINPLLISLLLCSTVVYLSTYQASIQRVEWKDVFSDPSNNDLGKIVKVNTIGWPFVFYESSHFIEGHLKFYWYSFLLDLLILTFVFLLPLYPFRLKE
jgi:hypothetical protein